MNENNNYMIPHNYKENGRLFNFVERSAAKKALICVAPITAFAFLLPLQISIKLFLWIVLVIPPSLLFLFDMDLLLLDFFRFNQNRRIYYMNMNEEGGYAYEQTEEQGRKKPV